MTRGQKGGKCYNRWLALKWEPLAQRQPRQRVPERRTQKDTLAILARKYQEFKHTGESEKKRLGKWLKSKLLEIQRKMNHLTARVQEPEKRD